MSDPVESQTSPTPRTNPLMLLVSDAFLIAIVSTLISVGVLKFGAQYFTPQPERQNFAIVNFDDLVQEYGMNLNAQVEAGIVPMADMGARTTAFTEEMKKRLSAYADAGTVVFRSESLLAAPSEVEDITPQLRKDLMAAGLLKSIPPKGQPLAK